MVASFSVFVNLGLEQRTSAGTIVETLASRAARPPFSVSAIPVDVLAICLLEPRTSHIYHVLLF